MRFGTLHRFVLAAVASAGCASTGGGAVRVASGLPAAPGAAAVPRPAGAPGNLKVLDWAGFKSAVSYTFDDGQPSHIEHYAALQATGVPLTFFVNANTPSLTSFVSTFSQAVRDGHEIGNHTANHCHADPDGTLYTTDGNDQRGACPGTSAGAELDDCTAFIMSALGAPRVFTAASPFGDVGFNAAASERFFLNRGVVGGTIAPNDDTDPFHLPMWAAVENDTVTRFNAAVDKAHGAGRWVIMLLHSIAPTTSRLYATVDIAAITGSIAYARSLGDVWIDTMANVGAYWRGQKLLSSLTPVVSGDIRTWTWTLPRHFPTGRYLRVRVDGGTLSQGGKPLAWDGRGYYEIALDAGSLTLAP
jgi:peptidoglycan/xylan/chitin deacetylase (PgdA/CDA1 family)